MKQGLDRTDILFGIRNHESLERIAEGNAPLPGSQMRAENLVKFGCRLVVNIIDDTDQIPPRNSPLLPATERAPAGLV